MKKFLYILIALVVLAGIVFIIVAPARGSGPGKYDAFATCIAQSGATFYGAFWCPHCQAQKKLFGTSAKLLPYVECSTPDASGQVKACTDKNITSYPTWELADGTRIPDENSAGVTLETLAAKTGCVLPQ